VATAKRARTKYRDEFNIPVYDDPDFDFETWDADACRRYLDAEGADGPDPDGPVDLGALRAACRTYYGDPDKAGWGVDVHIEKFEVTT
jgi:hypothetical protein